jgi:hypothetical protein
VNILSVFITSNKVSILLCSNGIFKSEKFNFYPFFQNKEDLEFLIISYLNSQNIDFEEVNIIPISTIFDLNIFGKKVNFLTSELKNRNDFLYIYLDNLNFYSSRNISASSLGLSKRSDNFISNRSVYSANKFTGDVEEIVYLSKSINDTYQTDLRKVVLAGDYFTNPEIPNEFKLNLLSEILTKGFYEVYLDTQNEFPNFLNIRNNTSVNLKGVEFEKFTYLLSSEKLVELLFESENTQKYLNLELNTTYYLYFDGRKLRLKFKGKEVKSGEVLFDDQFPGLFIDLRSLDDKKKNLGLESFRKVLSSIEKENDYTRL